MKYKLSAALLPAIILSTVCVGADASVTSPDQYFKQADQQYRDQVPVERLSLGGQEKQEVKDSRVERDAPGFFIKHIRLENPEKELSFLEPFLSPYENKVLKLVDTQALVKKLNTELVNHGYATSRVYMQEQNLSRGDLVLTVVPGYVHQVTVKGWPTFRWQSVFPLREGDVLNVFHLEQGVEQIKQFTSLSPKVELEPGPKENTSHIRITVDRQVPIYGSVDINNGGLSTIAKWQGSLSLGAENVLRAGDKLEGRLHMDLEQERHGNGTSGWNLFYGASYGWSTVQWRASQHSFHQRVPLKEGRFYRSSGTTKRYAVTIESVLGRNDKNRWSVYGELGKVESHNYAGDVRLRLQDKALTTVEVGLKHRLYMQNDTLRTSIGIRRGIGFWDAMPSNPFPQGPQSRYKMLVYSLDYYHPFVFDKKRKRTGHYTMHVEGQYTFNHVYLYGIDQWSIGGRYSVRGFDGKYSLQGESGFYVQQEVSFYYPTLRGEWYIGLDAGRVYGPSTEFMVGNHLVGAVTGWRGRIGKHTSYDVSVGAPVWYPKGFRVDDYVLYTQLRYAF